MDLSLALRYFCSTARDGFSGYGGTAAHDINRTTTTTSLIMTYTPPSVRGTLSHKTASANYITTERNAPTEFATHAELTAALAAAVAAKSAPVVVPPAPSAPTLSITDNSTSVDLSWTTPVGSFTNYEVWQVKTTAHVAGTWTKELTVNASTLTCTISGLSTTAAYSYKVRAIRPDVVGDYSNTVNTTSGGRTTTTTTTTTPAP